MLDEKSSKTNLGLKKLIEKQERKIKNLEKKQKLTYLGFLLLFLAIISKNMIIVYIVFGVIIGVIYGLFYLIKNLGSGIQSTDKIEKPKKIEKSKKIKDSELKLEDTTNKKIKPKKEIKKKSLDIESVLGGNLLNKIGMIILILGVAFFLQHSFVNNWISPTFQILIGVLAGIGLLVLGEIFNKKDYSVFSRVFTGGGSLILYISFFAANAFYTVIPDYYIALILCLIVTIITLTLAFRYKSTVIVYFGLIGVYASPFILNYNGDISKIFLLVYFSIINISLFIYNKFLKNQPVFYGYLFGAYLMPIVFGMELNLLIYFFLYYLIINISLAILSDTNDWNKSMIFLLIGGFLLPSISLASSNIKNSSMYLFYVFTIAIIYFTLFYRKNWTLHTLIPVGFMMVFIPVVFFNKLMIIPTYLFIGSIFLISVFLAFLKNNKIFYGFICVFAILLPRAMQPVNYKFLNEILIYNLYLLATILVLLFIAKAKNWNIGLLFSTILAYALLITTKNYLSMSFIFLITFYLIFSGFGFWFIKRKFGLEEIFAVIINGLYFISLVFYLFIQTPYLTDYKGLFLALMAFLYFIIGYYYFKNSNMKSLVLEQKKRIMTFFGFSLALLIIIIPVQLDGKFITLAWAALGFVLFWLNYKIKEEKLKFIGLGLFFIAMWKFFTIDFYVLKTQTAFLSVRSLIFIFFILNLLGIIYLYYINEVKKKIEQSRIKDKKHNFFFYFTNVLFLILIFSYINYEIGMLFTKHVTILMMMTLCWAIYATTLIILGIKYHISWLRLIGLFLFLVTILKLFFVDIWQLDKIFRISAFVGLGIILLVVSFIYNKFKIIITGK
jgi:hypothetical protein